MRTLLALSIMILPLTVGAAEPLGRLFFNPEQRAQLDAMRTKKVVAAQVKDEPAPEFVNYSGLIRRGDGKTTVWINNKALTESELRETDSLVGRIERDGRIVLQTGQAASAQSPRLKVGQRVELGTGRIEENYAVTNAQPVRVPRGDGKKPPAEGKEQDNEPAGGNVRDGQKPTGNPQSAARPEK